MNYLDYEDRYGETRADFVDRPQCPICHSYNYDCETYIYGADRDGNRGVERTECHCEDCEEDEDE